MSARANAFEGDAVVIGNARWDNVARAVDRTPGKTGLKSQAVSTSIMSDTTGRNFNASLLSAAPGLSSWANALASLAIVVQRTVGWNLVASIGQRTPVESGQESSTSSAVVMSRAAGWDADAGLRSTTPRLSGVRAQTSSCYAVVTVATVRWNSVALAS